MWDQLVAAIKARNSAEAIRLIGQMSPQDFVKDYTKLQYNQSPIHNAAYQGLADVVEQLLNKKPDLIGMVGDDGYTALHLATNSGREPIVNKLLQLKPDLAGMVDKNGYTALHWAAQNGSEPIVNKLLQLKPDLIGMVATNGYTALHLAAQRGSEPIVNKLLQLKPDLIGMVATNGYTALHLAAQNGSEPIVNKLLQLKPDLAGMVATNGYTALHLAAQNGSEPIVNKLLQLKPDLAGMVATNGYTALHRAAINGSESIVNKLLELKPDLAGMVDNYGSTALHWAAHSGSEQVVNKLLQLKPDLIGMVDNYGYTALHWAAHSGSEPIVNKLLQLKPDLIGMVDNSGKTALHSAAEGGSEQVVNKLLQLKPDLAGMVATNGYTALHLAASNGSEQVAGIYSPEMLITVLRLKDKNNDDQQIRQFLQKAITTYDNDIKANGGNANAYFKKANVLYALNRTEEALNNYEKALELDEEKYIEQIVLNMSANLANALIGKDLTSENVPDSVSIELTFLSGLDINNNIKEILGKRIATKLWSKNRNDIEQVQQETASSMTDQSNMDKIYFNVQKVQQIIMNNIINLSNNIALIEDTYNVDLSFLKNSLDHLVHSDVNSDSIIHDNGIITLSSLALLSLAKSDQIRDEKVINNEALAHKALNLHKLFQSLGVSKLFNLSDDIISKLKAATKVDRDQAQYVQKLAESHDSSHIALNIHDTDLTGDSIPLPI